MVCARALLDPVGVTSMASDKNVEQGDQIIVSEFCHLLEKSKQLFNGLRYGYQSFGILLASIIIVTFV